MEYLYNASVRSLPLAGLAALCLWRVQSASIKHAAWALVTAGMLVQLVSSPVLPPLRLPVLRPVQLVAVPVSAAGSMGITVPAHAYLPVLPVIYFAGVLVFATRLLRAVCFTRGLIRRSEPIAPRRYQSREIAVPVTAGGKILLPLDWAEWDAAKLRLVLAHEEAHVRRRDYLVALLARVNRCLFWFHPLAWWLDRHLAQLAEQACDDAALGMIGDRQQYAQTLLEMARAVSVSQGRLFTAGMAMEGNVEIRINRILDESRRIPRALGLRGWTALAASIAPAIYFAAAVQLAPAQTLMPIPTPAAPQPPPLVAQAAPASVPTAPNPPRAGGSDVGARPLLPFRFPNVYMGKTKTFFFSPDQILNGQVPATDSDLKVSVDLSVQGSVAISIPLPEESGQSDVITILRDQGGKDVLNSRLTRVTGTKWNTQVPLASGNYVLRVLIRNAVDQKMSTFQSNFEVK